MAREQVATRLRRRTGLNVVPIIIFVVIAAVVGGGLFAWDYQWRRKQQEATRPAPTDVVAKNLVENIIGKDTVKSSTFDERTSTARVMFESATFKPAQKKEQSREFLQAEAELASQAIMGQLNVVKAVDLTIIEPKTGATLATATVARTQKQIQVTYVDPRLK